jgi:hypothetical protein
MDLKNKIGLKEILAIAGCLACFAIFALILYSSNMSVSSLVNLENYFLDSMLTQTAGMTTTGAVIFILSPFMSAILAFVFLVAGFAFLSSYGFRKSCSRLGLISAVSAALMLVLFGFSIPSVFLSASIIVSSVYIIPLSNTYGKELKRWIFFRTGSHSISKALLITNILITVSVLLTVLISMNYYEQSFKNGLSDTMTSMISVDMPASLSNETNQKIVSMLEESPVISAYVRWLPVSSAFAVFFILEFMRSLIFSNIGGFFTDILIRANKRIR